VNSAKNIVRDSFGRIARCFAGHENDPQNLQRAGATRAYACLVGSVFGQPDARLRVPVAEPVVAEMQQCKDKTPWNVAKYRSKAVLILNTSKNRDQPD
jgi:hypothetical protein